jgi:hypothetical protein
LRWNQVRHSIQDNPDAATGRFFVRLERSRRRIACMATTAAVCTKLADSREAGSHLGMQVRQALGIAVALVLPA